MERSKETFIHLSKRNDTLQWSLTPFRLKIMSLLQSLTPLLMMMSSLFKEETSITVTSEKSYFYPNLSLVLIQGIFCSSILECCYNRYKNTSFKTVRVTASLACLRPVVIIFEDRKSRAVSATGFACLLTVSATGSAISATRSLS